MWDSLSRKVPDIGFPAGIVELEEEIIIIWVLILLPSQGFDFVVYPPNLPGRDIVRCMGDDAFEVVVQQSPEPQQMFVSGSHAHVHDVRYGFCHACLVSHLVGPREFSPDQIKAEQELVLPDDVLIPGKMAIFPDDRLLAEQRTALADDLSCRFIIAHR